MGRFNRLVHAGPPEGRRQNPPDDIGQGEGNGTQWEDDNIGHSEDFDINMVQPLFVDRPVPGNVTEVRVEPEHEG